MSAILIHADEGTARLKGFFKLLLVSLLVISTPGVADAKGKGYSSGGGKSYSSHSSSFSSSRGSSSSFGGGSKSFSSSSKGKSYSSGSDHSKGYGSGKSYSSGISQTHSRTHEDSSEGNVLSANGAGKMASSPSPSSSAMPFDGGAARAMKESASQRDFSNYKQSQVARSSGSDHSSAVPPIIPSSPRSTYDTPPTPTTSSRSTSLGSGQYTGSYRRASWYPDTGIYSTRSIRIRNYYTPYYSRPVVIYNDNYSSLFWWWLLDQSLEDRAQWAYHHRQDMDDARYRALVYQDLALENRVQELEQRQLPPDPNYVPAGMDRDLMYSDKYVDRAYATRPTHNGQIIFWFIMVPTAISVGGLFVWFIFFKRWQPTTA